MNETIKEGEYVEYVGRPNEKFLVSLASAKYFPFCISLSDGTYFSFDERGFMFKTDTHPIVKKTTPPKKKVLKEFEVVVKKQYQPIIVESCELSFLMNEKKIEEMKAKLIIEVEE